MTDATATRQPSLLDRSRRSLADLGRVAAGRRAERLHGARSTALLLGACFAIGLVSLVLPSTPTYDPWSWIIWGREVAHLNLDTVAGPSWKPLPVMFTTVFSLFGDWAPDLWLAVARGGGVLAVLLAYRVASRLAGGRFALLAGLVAAGALVMSSYYVRTVSLGNSEGLMLASMLGGIDRHLSGHRRQAFGLGILAALLRPEAWPFLGLYTLYLFWKDRGSWKIIVGGWVLILVLWLGPELWGSGNLLRASDRANAPTNPRSPAFADNPALALLEQARPVLILPVRLGLLAALVFGLIAYLRRRRDGAVLVIAGLAGAWLTMVAIMTSRGYSGNPRYLMPVTVLACVLAGVGYARAAGFGFDALVRLVRDRRLAIGISVAVALAFTALMLPFVGARAASTRKLMSQLNYQAMLRDDLGATVGRAGGRDKILACGAPTTGNYAVPAVAWELDVHIREVATAAAVPGVVFQTKATRRAQPDPVLPPGPRFEPVPSAGTWQLWSAGCRPGVTLP